MRSYIPFVNSQKDVDVLHAHYSDALLCRVTLESIQRLKNRLGRFDLWFDAALDGYERRIETDPHRQTHWEQIFSEVKHGKCLADAAFIQRPSQRAVRELVDDLLDRCVSYQPVWLSVPQLPLQDKKRNRINKLLAQATQEWQKKKRFSGKLILPAICTKHGQYGGRQADLIKSLVTRYQFGASGIWVVDSDLYDQEGRSTFVDRFRDLIRFHEGLSRHLPAGAIRIGGPYWGLNLVLWARGLVDHPAISLGTSYQYNLPNFKSRKGTRPVERVALEPLCRWARAAGLDQWLRRAAQKLSPTDPARARFEELRKNLAMLRTGKETQKQIAGVYRRWLDNLEMVTPEGRAVALYQQLSCAVVVGSSLPSLPEKGLARKPDAVAKQLMFHCL